MNTILTIVRWAITLPTLAVESVFKVITFIVLVLCLIIMAILFPLFKGIWRNFKDSDLYWYGIKWRGNFPITLKIFELWQ